MTQLFALCKISRPAPGISGLSTIGYDDDGEPILRIKEQSIMPGTIFEEAKQADADYLIGLDAARLPTDTELAVLASQGGIIG